MVSIMVATLIFFGVHSLPGDIALQIAASRYTGTAPDPSLADSLRPELGLDRPLLYQYAIWLWDLLHLDMGRSLVTGRPVAEELEPYFRRTLILGAFGLAGAMLISVPLGFLAGRQSHGFTDRCSAIYCSLMAALPAFLMAVLFVQMFVVELQLGSLSGGSTLARTMLPALVVALTLSAGMVRMVRNAVREVCSADYIAYAAMRGVPDRLIFSRNGVRNALLPVMGYISTIFVYLVYDIVVIEVVFNYPGIGLALYQAVLARDIPTLQAATLILVLTYMLVSFAVDALALWLDPRARREVI